MLGFDTIVAVDWSSGNDTGPRPRKDAIWAAVHRNGKAHEPVYLRNRQVAQEWLTTLFAEEQAAGRRLLAGFDFPFGYPTGFATALAGSADPLAVWDWFEERITDTPQENNRFDLAGAINLALGNGKGPFWFNGLKREIAGLGRNKQGYVNLFTDRRRCEELAKGAFTCWQMGGTGAVGGQMMTGMAVLARLRRQFDVAIWPFQSLDAPIACVEIWPSLTAGPAPDGMIKDAWQVAEVARQIASLGADRLHEILDVEAPQEGWIFGLGYEAELQTPPLRNDCFALPAGVHWTPVDEALDLLKDRLAPVAGIETLPAMQALGRVLATPVAALRSNPPLPNTAVDGYGFAGGRGAGAHVLPLAKGRAAAGDAPAELIEGRAVRVLTGAALPRGVDTVVLQEDVVLRDGEIRFSGPVKAGSNTRKAGEDVKAGQEILASGRRLTPADLALMAASGVGDVQLRKALRVGILSTGDELVEAGETAVAGQIHDANRPMLSGLVTSFGHDCVDLGRAPDDRAALGKRLDVASSKVDVILTSGGASAGDEDHMSAILQEAGALSLWRIAIKPGRPLALGMWKGVPVFGLPGNPVAAMVCTLIFARPAMDVLAGAAWAVPQGFDVPAGFTKTKKAGRREYLRARIRDGRAEVFASEGSGRVSGLSWAEGLIELPEPAGTINAGDLVRYIPYGSFGVQA
ncbi:molybdopterin molybdenumtransferase MoeA [Sulfitobacter sp. M57]|uniref:molybdopterin-binding protein n=1 Tax=unclassified Sulfitobacter TaxID=196795 RepID=UPI0023E295A1|nr:MULTISPECIES: molybdopterin-binding protein [unclassified Sulfitobacter]MDF3415559.1 molybdopterin molybdenumtransferase MoeA [Sulfitobacter sp. KE5]MDF3423040.1 molybdopterin molybdenumtransferase MoeA [Sulfitobacter sp. KE43]MDF3434105.1 molybdopterin molybdenumtransferase MoeA [Sulfitobacter sp. KE42]MDF3459862.1 molybdopterin molybdenumtransferase MoeA [Sulfitobacter sp. S74]MDF3463644.1 molybdopterin molybdenumtransferase MoeA [Sulfitobacter sp. Ks18]